MDRRLFTYAGIIIDENRQIEPFWRHICPAITWICGEPSCRSLCSSGTPCRISVTEWRNYRTQRKKVVHRVAGKFPIVGSVEIGVFQGLEEYRGQKPLPQYGSEVGDLGYRGTYRQGEVLPLRALCAFARDER